MSVQHYQVTSWRDLELFGIRPLTGEACAYSMRLLCDLTEGGAALIRDYLGLPADCQLAPNWNSGAVASIMLTREQLKPLALFTAWQEGFDVVIETCDGTLILLSKDHEYFDHWTNLALEATEKYTIHRNPHPIIRWWS